MPFADLPGGLRMHYEDDSFTDPWRKAEAVVLHHGQAKNGRLWCAWVPLLAREFRVIRVDARGYGDSSVPPPGYAWSMEGFADDLLHLIDHLGLEKAHLVGETAGGAIAMVFAGRYPDRILTVAASGSAFKFRGDPLYGNFYRMVEDQGVEARVRCRL